MSDAESGERFTYEDDFDTQDEYQIDQYRGMESRLWENDSSYLVAVAPKIFENNRIRLKLIMGYRVQSVVHGLPDPYENDAAASLLPSGRMQRRRLYDFYSNQGRFGRGMTTEEFNQLPEHEQRRVLRERFLAKQLAQDSELQSSQFSRGRYNSGPRPLPSMSNFAYWASRNFNQLGWKSMVGTLAFIAGLYRTIRSFYGR
ncbi:hypothetical protein AKO1_013735 [Acrasis kona]|uniref:Uncharacterized protein n=1 Tax=Acrasis kona TaxID=1008807 RepID=A0AAW2ZID8_9EUKA